MADPLIGKFFTAFEKSKSTGEREMTWNGQIRSRVKEGLYLVKLMNAVTLVLAGMVDWDRQIMVSLDDMKDWEFFDSREAWSDNYGAYAQQSNERHRREAKRAANQHPHAESGSSPGSR